MSLLTDRDLQTLNECIDEINAYRGTATFLSTIIAALPKLIPSEYPCVNIFDIETQELTVAIAPPEINAPEEARIFKQFIWEHPVFTHTVDTGDTQAFKISDFLTARQFHNLGLYHDFYRRYGVEDQLSIRLPVPQPIVIGISLCRSRRNFADRDLRLLNMFGGRLIRDWPILETLRQRRAELAHPGHALLTHLKSTVPGITDQEATVWWWLLAQGKNIEEVATLLGIEASTVEKHRERIYKKLGVHNRHTAMIRAREILDLPSQEVSDQASPLLGGTTAQGALLSSSEEPEVVRSPTPQKKRACLKCTEEFLSEGPHHRLCKVCRACTGL